jgi:hypothetical protein
VKVPVKGSPGAKDGPGSEPTKTPLITCSDPALVTTPPKAKVMGVALAECAMPIKSVINKAVSDVFIMIPRGADMTLQDFWPLIKKLIGNEGELKSHKRIAREDDFGTNSNRGTAQICEISRSRVGLVAPQF